MIFKLPKLVLAAAIFVGVIVGLQMLSPGRAAADQCTYSGEYSNAMIWVKIRHGSQTDWSNDFTFSVSASARNGNPNPYDPNWPHSLWPSDPSQISRTIRSSPNGSAQGPYQNFNAAGHTHGCTAPDGQNHPAYDFTDSTNGNYLLDCLGGLTHGTTNGQYWSRPQYSAAFEFDIGSPGSLNGHSLSSSDGSWTNVSINVSQGAQGATSGNTSAQFSPTSNTDLNNVTITVVFTFTMNDWTLNPTTSGGGTLTAPDNGNGHAAANSTTGSFSHDVTNNGPDTANFDYDVQGCYHTDGSNCNGGDFGNGNNGNNAYYNDPSRTTPSQNNITATPGHDGGSNGSNLPRQINYQFAQGAPDGAVYCQRIDATDAYGPYSANRASSPPSCYTLHLTRDHGWTSNGNSGVSASHGATSAAFNHWVCPTVNNTTATYSWNVTDTNNNTIAQGSPHNVTNCNPASNSPVSSGGAANTWNLPNGYVVDSTGSGSDSTPTGDQRYCQRINWSPYSNTDSSWHSSGQACVFYYHPTEPSMTCSISPDHVSAGSGFSYTITVNYQNGHPIANSTINATFNGSNITPTPHASGGSTDYINSSSGPLETGTYTATVSATINGQTVYATPPCTMTVEGTTGSYCTIEPATAQENTSFNFTATIHYTGTVPHAPAGNPIHSGFNNVGLQPTTASGGGTDVISGHSNGLPTGQKYFTYNVVGLTAGSCYMTVASPTITSYCQPNPASEPANTSFTLPVTINYQNGTPPAGTTINPSFAGASLSPVSASGNASDTVSVTSSGLSAGSYTFSYNVTGVTSGHCTVTVDNVTTIQCGNANVPSILNPNESYQLSVSMGVTNGPAPGGGSFDITVSPGTNYSNVTASYNATSIVSPQENETAPGTAQPITVAWTYNNGSVHIACGPVTINVVSLPYFKVLGSGVQAGGDFEPSCGSTGGALGGWYNNGAPFNGSSSQFMNTALGSIIGVASAQGTARAPAGLSFANVDTSGGSDPSPNLGGKFNDNTLCMFYPSQPSSTHDLTDINPKVGHGQLTNGALTYTGDLPLQGGQLGTDQNVSLFVTGNVYIKKPDISYSAAGGGWTPGHVPSFVLEATGNIYIDSNVTNLDGIYVAKGKIYTCATGMGSPAGAAGLYGTCNKQLVVHGSFIASQVNLMRTIGSIGDAPGDGSNNNCVNRNGPLTKGYCAAELFDFGPELYLSQPNIDSSSGGATTQYDSITALPPVL